MGAFYGGIITGPLIDLIKYRYAFLLAGILSLFGFTSLSLYTDSKEIGAVDTFFIIIFLIAVSFAASLACIAAIAIVVENFSEK